MMHSTYQLMIVDDEEDICNALEFLLSREGYSVDMALGGKEALGLLEKNEYDLVLTDVKMDGMSGLELLEHIKAHNVAVPVIVMTAYASVEGAVDAMKKGASDYIIKPFINEEVKITVRRLLEHRSLQLENQALKQQLNSRLEINEFLGNAKKVIELFQVIEKAAPTKSNMLLLGESGTGKSMVAELIHRNSPRRGKSFMAINCSAIPDTLLESELFGYKKGAFTGANTDKLGLIEAANSGTLFLDEIGDMPMPLQSKLLKVIDTGEVFPLGGLKPRKVDVRYIAATNRNIESAISEGLFREDLYYRLDVIRLDVPPLRERKDDIPMLAKHFVHLAAKRHGSNVSDIQPQAVERLMAYDWPGNVRELQNVIERTVILSPSNIITVHDLPDKLSNGNSAGGVSLKESLELQEAAIIKNRLVQNDGNKELTAKSLGIDLATLYRKMKKYEINGKKEGH